MCKSVCVLSCRGMPASASLPAEPIALLDEIESGLPFSSSTAGTQQQKPGKGSEEQGKAKKHKRDKEKHKKESKEKKHKRHKKDKKAKEGGPSGLPTCLTIGHLQIFRHNACVRMVLHLSRQHEACPHDLYMSFTGDCSWKRALKPCQIWCEHICIESLLMLQMIA